MLLCSLIFLWLLYMKKTMLVICPLELVFVHFACYWYCIHFVSHPVSSTSKCGFLAVLYRLNFVMTGPRGRLPHPGRGGGVSPPNVSEQICWSWFREWNVSFWWRDRECSHGKLEQREESIHEQRDFLQSCGFRCHGFTSFYTRQGQGFFWPESRQRLIWWHRNDNCFVFEDGSSVHVVSWIFLVFSHAESRCSSLQSSPPVFSILADGSHTEGWTGHPAGGVSFWGMTGNKLKGSGRMHQSYATSRRRTFVVRTPPSTDDGQTPGVAAAIAWPFEAGWENPGREDKHAQSRLAFSSSEDRGLVFAVRCSGPEALPPCGRGSRRLVLAVHGLTKFRLLWVYFMGFCDLV